MEAEQMQFTAEEQSEIDEYYEEFAKLQQLSVQDVKKEFTLLHYAARLGKIELVKSLVFAGDDVNAKLSEFYYCRENFTPLHEAVCSGNIEIVEFLVSKGADVDAKGWRWGCETPLRCAVRYGNIEAVKFLASKGADIHVKGGMYGDSTLHLAADCGKADIAKYLISVGVNVHAKDRHGMTPLHYAVSGNEVAVAKIFISEGAGVNVRAKGNGGETPLHLAARRGQIEAVKYLVSAGARVNAKDKRGKTPLDAAKYGVGDTAVIEYLESIGAKLGGKSIWQRIRTLFPSR